MLPRRFQVILLWIGVLLLPLGASAASAQETFDSANRAYGQGKYDLALTHYHQLLKWNIAHPDLFFNLSNTYAQKKQFGLALLYVEKALKYRPESSDYRHNRGLILQRINKKLTSQNAKFHLSYVSDGSGLERLARVLPQPLLVSLFLGAYFVLFLLLALPIFVAKLRKRKLLKAGVVLFSLASLIFGSWLGANALISQGRRFGIVVAEKTQVYGSSLGKTAAFPLYEGTKVRIVDTTHPKRLKIRLSEESEGWIDRDHLKEI